MEQSFIAVNPSSGANMAAWMLEVNGQRKYGGPPPGWIGPAPGPGCEVYISQIPVDMYEDRLIPLFQSVAPLYEFRLMMNFSGQNHGFAYAKYGNPCSADAAIEALHMHLLQPGVKLSVKQSTDKKQLCLSNLPTGLERDDLIEALRSMSDGVDNVAVRPVGRRGRDVCAIVRYSSHHTASMAKKILIQDFRRSYGMSISVRWLPSSPKSSRQERGKEPSQTPSRSQSQSNPPFHPRSFSRAVGGPTLASGDFVHQLSRLCEPFGLGSPLYKVWYGLTGPGGVLCFTYRVELPAVPIPWRGVVDILPDSCSTDLEAQVRQAVAEQLLNSASYVEDA